eukprot:gb/GEZN01010429.1/.p1 GENE.gb/GEZN01010429.1/~~gb/GEZN01010429.1/.p1  ORF type:complete len:266 (+),score=30.79 gb/GEZN01010429.1/:35-832(+)
MRSRSLFLFSSLFAAYGQTYCSSGVGPTNVNDGNMGPVRLEGNSKTIDDNYNCPGLTNVQDKTSQVADLSQGHSYTVKWTTTSCSTLNDPIASAAWIDYNQDGTFSTEERLNPTNVVGYQTHEVTFTVPSTATLGVTRMRVQAQETTATDVPLNPCFGFRWGGTKDFGIEIQTPKGKSKKGGGGGGGLSSGSQILIIMAVLGSLYVLGGSFYNKRQGHEGCRSVFPHYDWWFIRLPILVKAGLNFTRAKITGSAPMSAEDEEDLL